MDEVGILILGMIAGFSGGAGFYLASLLFVQPVQTSDTPDPVDTTWDQHVRSATSLAREGHHTV